MKKYFGWTLPLMLFGALAGADESPSLTIRGFSPADTGKVVTVFFTAARMQAFAVGDDSQLPQEIIAVLGRAEPITVPSSGEISVPKVPTGKLLGVVGASVMNYIVLSIDDPGTQAWLPSFRDDGRCPPSALGGQNDGCTPGARSRSRENWGNLRVFNGYKLPDGTVLTLKNR